MKQYAVIVAGGKGKRMGHEIPKQFLPLNGKAILLHSLETFKKALPNIQFVLVLPKDQVDLWQEISKGTDFQDVVLAKGGAERSDSVLAGLEKVPDDAIVGIHDAVRPLVSRSTIQNAYATAEKQGNAIPVVQLVDSLRQKQASGTIAVDRSEFLSVQTPQCFQAKALKNAYADQASKVFSDDASLAEAYGEKINTVEGNPENIKITRPQDLKIAEFLLAQLHQ